MYTKFSSIPSIDSQDIERNKILTSIKGHNSVAKLRNLTLYNPNLDIINVNVYTKFNSILSVGSPDIEGKRNSERKPNSNINQGP